MAHAALDPHLVHTLYLSLAPRLKRRVDLPPDVVEDLVQEAFLRLLNQPPNDLGNLAGWVYRVFSNLVLDYFRSHSSGPDVVSEALPARETFEVTETEQEIAGWLRGFQEGLPNPYAEAVRLADFEGLTMRAIAARLGLSVSGAKSRVQRGRAKLYQSLIACCHFVLDDVGRAIDYQKIPPGDCACAPDPARSCRSP